MAGQASNMGKGGMISKIEAAEICFKNKSDMVIASGVINKPIRSLNGKGKATWFVKR
jgi:glutamate 5-kinase